MVNLLEDGVYCVYFALQSIVKSWNYACVIKNIKATFVNFLYFLKFLSKYFLYLYFLDCTRFLFASWWIFVTILSSFYTANLTAFLTLSYYKLGISTIDDVAFGYNWFAMKGRAVDSAIENVIIFFKFNSFPLFHDIIAKISITFNL